ncbi:hypothetical protein ABL78_2896 [Leptomonas seymouri]|uniref:Uncharacterized protein n=1 Tax=Leptomonas seymouri TaxID=5684 RepID=A0A0N1PE25_LEPSE|nr:hypothetical protein ABL78_2896 [Leptomonas seymouri]|eukprot:KPI88020.1 hypothetical protein ABL78_2896 [Leptomonas seymouri]
MKTLTPSRPTSDRPNVRPNPPATREDEGSGFSHSNGSGNSSATPDSADNIVAWGRTAAFPAGIVSKASLSSVRHLAMQRSPLFEYFSLLCSYHGATCVPEFWAALLADSPLTSVSQVSGATDADAYEQSDGTREAELFCSSVTTLDFSACYVGPNTLLALADLFRVHCVALADRYHNTSAAALRGGTPAVVVRAVAPLWSKVTVPFSSNSSSVEMCSLLPQLRTLRLVHLCLDFSTDDNSEPHRNSGNKILLYVLDALQGHPCLQLLDLSGNPIASALVPTLSRLVQAIPSLTTLVLDNTLLQESEKEMLSAQCLLNQMRLERAAKQSTLAASSPATGLLPSPLSLIQTSWLAQTLRDVQRALEVGISAVPWLLGKSTAYVRRYTAQSLPAATTCTSTAPAATNSAAVRKSAASPVLDGTAFSSVTALMQSFRPSTDTTYLCYDAPETSVSGPSPRESESPLRLGSVWTPECTEVVRSAFLDRQLARQRVLGGRAVWPNVPLPAAAEGSGDAGRVEEDTHSNCRPTVEDLSSSLFLKGIRQQLLPPPQAPPGLRQNADAAFLTTAEENYSTICQAQDKQWTYLVERLAELLVPMQLHHDEVLYSEGDLCSKYVYFLPKDVGESQTCVVLHAGAEVNRVLPGQWVGEAEGLGCMSLYSHSATMMVSSSASNSRAKNVACASPFARHSTARFVTSASGGVTVWALPHPVAFFFLYSPYQQLQKQFIQRTPMSAFAHIHPVHLASVPVLLEQFHWTRNATTLAQHAEVASTVLCTASYLASHIVLLQEGEYLLRIPQFAATTPSAMPLEEEGHHLLSGNTVVTTAVLDLDADARSAGIACGVEEFFFPSGRGRALGKEAALRQFRMRKAALQRRSCDSAAIAKGADVASENSPADDEGIEKDSMELRPYPSHAPVAHWRYAGLSNEAFAALCPPLRLSLTRHCCVVPGDEA